MEFSWEVSKKDRHLPVKTYAAIGVVSVSASIYFFVTQSYFATVLFIIAPVVLYIGSTQGHAEVKGKINEEGVKVNNRTHKYKDLDFFDIIDDNLVLKPRDGEAVYIQIVHDDRKKVSSVLSNYIPQKEHEESLTEIMNRFLRIH